MELFYGTTDGVSVRLEAEDSGHLVRVLRHRAGDEIFVIDGDGTLLRCRLTDDNPRAAVAQVLESTPDWGSHPYRLTVACCPTKNTDRYEWFIEKATEIGIDRIVPVIGDRSERRVFRSDRASRIALSATKQSLKARIPAIDAPLPLRDFLASLPAPSPGNPSAIDGPLPLGNPSAPDGTLPLGNPSAIDGPLPLGNPSAIDGPLSNPSAPDRPLGNPSAPDGPLGNPSAIDGTPPLDNPSAPDTPIASGRDGVCELRAANEQLSSHVEIAMTRENTRGGEARNKSEDNRSTPAEPSESSHFQKNAGELRLIAYCFENEEFPRISIQDALRSFTGTDITILIGPEGDFSPEEAKAALAHGFIPIHLGPSRLRTETAALTATLAVYSRYSL